MGEFLTVRCSDCLWCAAISTNLRTAWAAARLEELLGRHLALEHAGRMAAPELHGGAGRPGRAGGFTGLRPSAD